MSDTNLSRRRFNTGLSTAAAGAASLNLVSNLSGQDAASNRLVVGVMGLGRGRGHIKGWLQVPGVEIGYVCDVDDARLEGGVRGVKDSGQEQPPKAVKDFREMLADPNVDVISIATPNYWHTPAAILAMKAGKHVYVEKPGSHNAREGEMIVEAARKYDKKVQMGNQRRSYPSMITSIQKLHEGIIGKPLFSRAAYLGQRPGIKKGKPAPVPDSIDYDIWLGPCPDFPYKDNLIPYNWHWHWHFGGGEMANNGVHSLDIVRWALQAEKPPLRVSYVGNRYHYDDDQETPDTGCAVYDFEEYGGQWEQSSCHRIKPENRPFVTVSCEGGLASFDSNTAKFYDLQGKEIEAVKAEGGDKYHFQNLADAIRADVPLNSEIEIAQKSTLWCHLANIAHKTGKTLEIDQATGKPTDAEAMELWGREYRKGWEPTV
ncbi:MAG: putative dehydrogenase [Verrucomicrobiales bacterium]|jgi:predicted dehydrogenase